MNSFATVVFCLAVATASAGHLGYGLVGHEQWAHVGHVNPAAHIASGSVGVSADGVVIAGPSGSVRTNNGIHGHGAGAIVAGPAGDVRTQAGHAQITGPGAEHHAVAHVAHVAHVAPVVHQTLAYAQPIAQHAVVAGPATHTTIVGPSASATVVAGSAHHGVYAAAPAWGHSGVVASVAQQGWVAAPAVATTWGTHGIAAHGLVGHGLIGNGFEHNAVLAGHGVYGHHGW